MLDIGFSEILLTSAIALIVLGPERLPKVARQIGNWMGRARAMARQLSEQLDREVSADELMRQRSRAAAPGAQAATAASRSTGDALHDTATPDAAALQAAAPQATTPHGATSTEDGASPQIPPPYGAGAAPLQAAASTPAAFDPAPHAPNSIKPPND